ncbi:cucumopine synthase-related protein [Nonomuraea sp. NPDC004297]
MTISGWGELGLLTDRLRTQEPPEIHALRTGTLAHQPGSYGQYFTTWDFANAILRDYSMNVYQTLALAASGDLSVNGVLAVLRRLDPIYSEYLGDSGFTTLTRSARELRQSEYGERDALIAALTVLTRYVNRLTAWSHHYFPWDQGERYRYDEAPPEAAAPAGADPHASASTRRVPLRLSWQPLGIEVRAELFADLNEELCQDFLSALPFTVLQDHAVVTGQSMYAWTPLVTLAAAPVVERICDAPVGRLRYSQATGNKLVLQYGHTTETLSVPVLGQVHPDDTATLDDVGRAVWKSTFHTKEHIWLTAEPA